MDWNGDESRWELSTAALLSLASRALNSVEYDAEVRTSEGLDLVKTRFKIVGLQVFQGYSNKRYKMGMFSHFRSITVMWNGLLTKL